MPRKRQYRKKKTFRRRRRTGFRRKRNNMGLRMQAYQGHLFSRWVNLGAVWTVQQGAMNQLDHLSLSANAGSTFQPGAGGYADWFQLTIPANTVGYGQIAYALHWADIAGNAELGSTFDQYKIKGWAIKIIPGWNTYIAGNSGGGGGATPAAPCLPIVHHAIDYDDAILYANSNESSVDLMKERWSYKTVRFDGHNRQCSRYIPSAVKVGLAGPAGAALLAMGRKSKRTWIDTSAGGVAHYGYKCLIECANPTAIAVSMTFKIECRVYFQTRGSH